MHGMRLVDGRVGGWSTTRWNGWSGSGMERNRTEMDGCRRMEKVGGIGGGGGGGGRRGGKGEENGNGVDGLVDGWVNGWVDGLVDAWMNGWWLNGWVGE